MKINFFTYQLYFTRKKLIYFGLFAFLVYFIFCLPSPLFKTPTATILLSKDGQLMNAKIADDGQWRFPAADSVPHHFKAAIIAYEDKSFYQHPGISARGIARAIISNMKAKRVVSGGSTLTMQIARLSRRGKRTLWNKIIEAIWALRLELSYSKEELINIYASNAPFGGNVVGLEAAAWRYYGQPAHNLSWAEVATLAVLPNSPSLVRPGKNEKTLLQRRNSVLKTLLEQGEIDEVSYELSLEEPLIGAPKPLPSYASHLMENAIQQRKKGQRIQTTIHLAKQKKFTEILERHQTNLDQNHISNAALLIIDIQTNEVVTYIGNTATQNEHHKYVDLIQAPRSSGSILKPFLFAAMMQEGSLHNEQLIPDVPMSFEQFSPKNYEDKFEGAVKAKNALSRSLNIPAVYLLKTYGISQFLHILKDLKLRHVNKDADHYGLSLILGGAENSLWDVANAYAGMAKTLNHYNRENLYSSDSWDNANVFTPSTNYPAQITRTAPLFDASSVYSVFQALLDVNRPYMEASWRHFSSSRKIAWKTGTSFGNRDAWAVGLTPHHVVAVWVGNASGEGRPPIIGTTAAGPIMFNVFSHLDTPNNWFLTPHDELEKMSICKESGYRSTFDCTLTDTVLVPKNALRSPSCYFHKIIVTDKQENYRFHQECTQGIETKLVSRFVLPPLQAYFYKNAHPNYKDLPPFHPNCMNYTQETTFTIVYPQHNGKFIGVTDLDGKAKEVIFEASHPVSGAKLFWHVDNQYIGETKERHTIRYMPETGTHLLTVVDELGNQKKINFTVLDK